MSVKNLQSENEEFIMLLRKHPELRDQLWDLLEEKCPVSTPPRFDLTKVPLCDPVG